MDKLQKDKIREYEQKMITLTQEISVTQNLYKAFLEAKARAQQWISSKHSSFLIINIVVYLSYPSHFDIC